MSMKPGLQMYTVKKSFAENPLKTLEAIADAGIKTVELACLRIRKEGNSILGFPGNNGDVSKIGMSAKEIRAKSDQAGINIISAMIWPEDFYKLDSFFTQTDVMKRTFEYYAEVGCKHLSIGIDFWPNLDYLLNRCELYNKLGEMCQNVGIQLAYHNHYNEFQTINGKYLLDLIVENTDPKNFKIELDAYWTFRGALDPVSKIRQYGDRITMIHQKDFPIDQIRYADSWTMLDQNVLLDWDKFHSIIKPEFFIELGEGIIKIQDIIDAGNEFNIPYILIEQDYTKHSEIESLKISIKNLKKIRDLSWE